MLYKAHMMKLAWHMLTDSRKLWVRVMKAKYYCGMNTIPSFNCKANSTSTWKSIVSSWNVVKNNIIWIVKNSPDIRFWKDCWIPGCRALVDILDNPMPDVELHFSVVHYVVNGSYDWSNIQLFVPMDICEKIAIGNPL